MSIGAARRTCQVDGYSIAYYREGEGEVILLVHGITTYSFIWRRIFTDLARFFDVIAIDLLGCGDSDKPLDVSYSLNAHADRIKSFAATLGIHTFHFIGHDLGGGIGQIFAARHPELLYDLILINSVGYDFWPVQPITSLKTPVIRHIIMASIDLGALNILVRRGFYRVEKVTDELIGLFLRPFQTGEGRKAFLHFASCLDNRDLMDIAASLKKLRFPVLIIRGDADPYLGRIIALELHKEIPASKLLCVPGASHFIQEEKPAELTEAIVSFLGGARG